MIEQLKFNVDGLIPVITQDIDSNQVLMQAYMNKEAIQKTLETKEVTYYSRSRKALWTKGSTSGNTQTLIEMTTDCDFDSVLIKVKQKGPACHTNQVSCFFNNIYTSQDIKNEDVIAELYKIIENRKKELPEKAYTTYLFEQGLDKILKKVGEETSEVIIASKNNDKIELVNEVSDLVYHLLVLLVNQEVSLSEIKKELINRKK